MELAERIRKARVEYLSMTQRELGDAVGVDPITVSRWERGVAEPRVRQLRALAQLASLPIQWFYEDDAATAARV